MRKREPDTNGSGSPVTVIGLGILGSVVAGVFLDRGHPTTVWNRTAGKADPLIAKGAVRAATVADAAAATPLVVICVSTYQDVHALLASVGDALSGRVLVNLGSGTPEQARELAAWAKRHGAGYLDGAAMSGTRLVGRPEALFLYSGSPDAFAAHRPALASLGAATYLGADPGLASLYDTALFSVIWGTVSGFLHAAALAAADGVDPTAFASVAAGHLPFVAGVITEHAHQIRDGRYPNDDGTLRAHAAAMDHLIQTGRTRGVTTEALEAVRALQARGVAAGHGADGIASLFEVLRKPAPTA